MTWDYYGFVYNQKFHTLLASPSHNTQVLAANRPYKKRKVHACTSTEALYRPYGP